MAFAEPRWLLGLLALVIPIALHLRGRRRGSVVPVGSLRWLEGRAVTARSPRRLHRPWLLLLRAAVFVALVVALADPVRLAGVGGRTWVLVAPEVVARAPLDSLRRLGELRQLAPTLPAVGAPASRAPTERTDVWSLLREADLLAPASVELIVVAPPGGEFYRGVRPRLRHEVRWVTVAMGRDTEVRAARPGPVTIVATADRAEDASVLAAAFDAIVEVRGGAPVRIARRDEPLAPAAADWIVWLGPRAVPASVQGKVTDGLVLVTDGDSLPVGPGDRVVWRTEDGAPRLVAHRTGLGLHYRLRGRFHPGSWPGVLEPEFADLLDSLRAGGTSAEPPLSERQRSPSRSSVRGPGVPVPSPSGPQVERWLLLVALSLLLAERLITAREHAA